jgi:hypothetical protein
MENWTLFAPEDLVEVIDQLRAMAAKLNLKISEDDFGEEE